MKKSWIVVLIFLGFLAGAYLFGGAMLKAQMEEALSAACSRPVRIRSAQIVLPPGVRLSGIQVPAGSRESRAPLSIEELTARVGVSQALQGKPALELEIKEPVLYAEWTPEARALFSLSALRGAAGPMPLPLARLKIQGGQLTLVDETVVPAVPWVFRRLAGEAVADRGPGEYSVRFSGLLSGETQEDLGRVEVEGSFFAQGPVEGKLTLEYREIRFLSPYLRRILGAAPSQGSARLESRITVHGGVLMSHHQVTASGVLFPAQELTTLDLEGNRLVDLLKDSQGQIHLGFIVTGRLGQKMDWSDLATGAMREAMRQALSRSIQQVLQETEQTRPAQELLQEKQDSLGR